MSSTITAEERAEIAAQLREDIRLAEEEAATHRNNCEQFTRQAAQAEAEAHRLRRLAEQAAQAMQAHQRRAELYRRALEALETAPGTTRPFPSVEGGAEPGPARPYVAGGDTCHTCGAPVQWDEQRGHHHADDGTPAGGLCTRRPEGVAA